MPTIMIEEADMIYMRIFLFIQSEVRLFILRTKSSAYFLFHKFYLHLFSKMYNLLIINAMSDFNQEPKDPQQSPYQGSQPPYSNQNAENTTPPNPNIGQQPYNDGSFNNPPQEPRPNNNLVLAIVATVLSFCSCCGYGGCLGLILGIIAIVFASQVDSKYNSGDIFGAQKSANNAKILSYVALATVAVSVIIIIITLATTDWTEVVEQYRQALEQYQ